MTSRDPRSHPAGTARPGAHPEHGGANPLLIIGGIAVVAFVVALLAFRGGSGGSRPVSTGASVDTVEAPAVGACGEGAPDPSYSVSTDSDPNPPRLDGTVFHLTVRHGGAAVTGAKVCVAANMPTMLHAGVSQTAKEVSGGRYDVQLSFSMDGSWAGTITIAQPGQPIVSVPLAIQVAPS